MTFARDWAGAVGEIWADEWQRTDRGFSAMTPHLDAAILAVAPERGKAIDIGCGAGGTSLALARARPGLTVTGIDLSPALIDTARSRAAGYDNLSFRVADATAAPDLTADLLVSRHGVMFFDDPVAGMSALRLLAVPGAALVFSCFDSVTLNRFAADPIAAATGHEPQPATAYAPGPFGFADPDFVTATLTAAGWGELHREAFAFGYRVGAGDDPVGDAVSFFSRIGPSAPLLRNASPEERPAMIARLTEVVRQHFHDGAVDFPAAVWLWSARAA